MHIFIRIQNFENQRILYVLKHRPIPIDGAAKRIVSNHAMTRNIVQIVAKLLTSGIREVGLHVTSQSVHDPVHEVSYHLSVLSL